MESLARPENSPGRPVEQVAVRFLHTIAILDKVHGATGTDYSSSNQRSASSPM